MLSFSSVYFGYDVHGVGENLKPAKLVLPDPIGVPINEPTEVTIMKPATTRNVITYHRCYHGITVYSWSGSDADGIVWIENLHDMDEKECKHHFKLQYQCSRNTFKFLDVRGSGLGSYSHSYDDNL